MSTGFTMKLLDPVDLLEKTMKNGSTGSTGIVHSGRLKDRNLVPFVRDH